MSFAIVRAVERPKRWERTVAVVVGVDTDEAVVDGSGLEGQWECGR